MILRLSASKKAVIAIDDIGNTFMTSVEWIKMLLDGRARGNFIELKVLEGKVSPDRFRSQLAPSMDVMAQNAAVKRDKDKNKMIEDIEVW